MSSPKVSASRRRKAQNEDEDYVPEVEAAAPKRPKTTKPKPSPVQRSSDPYNHRHHDPTVARLGIPVEGTIRHFILSQVALSTHIITWLHVRSLLLAIMVLCSLYLDPLLKARSPVVDSYFIIMSFLGDQILYVCLLPWFLWVLDPYFGRLFLLLLISGTTLGNCLKNIFALPRPPSPPLWTHHRHEDFGMPSTHTWNAVSMSMFFSYWVWQFVPKGYIQLLLVLGVIWYTSSMFVSRMYLAAHSHVDTISGFVLGMTYFGVWVWIHPAVDRFLNTNVYAPQIVLLGVFLLLLFHPRSSRPSPSFRYSMSLSGLGLGMTIGVHLTRFVGPFWIEPIKSLFTHEFRDSILHSLPPDWHKFASSFLGVILGIIMLLTTYLLVKFCALIFLLILFRIPPIAYFVHRFKVFLRYCALPHPLALDNLDHPQWHEEREVVNPKDAKMLSDMIGTIVVGIIITHMIPVILNRMGLMMTSLLSK